MGPSVKFVLTIIDAFPNQKNGGIFCGTSLGRTFSRLSFLNISLREGSTKKGKKCGLYQTSFKPPSPRFFWNKI